MISTVPRAEEIIERERQLKLLTEKLHFKSLLLLLSSSILESGSEDSLQTRKSETLASELL